MCYDIQVGYEKRIKEGMRKGGSPESINALINEYNERFDPRSPMPHVYHHVSAFQHPDIGVIYEMGGELVIESMTWGLMPFWSKDLAGAEKLWDTTVNARSETMFKKPSFRSSAKNKRGVFVIDSFYEHHHFMGNAYPLNISYKDGNPFVVGVIWDEWTAKETGEVKKTFSIVTVAGNEFVAVIHNKPKLGEPRMPLILQSDDVNTWLGTKASDDIHLTLHPLCKPLSSAELSAHTVRRLGSKEAVGNIPESLECFEYPELSLDEELQVVLKAS